MQKTVILMPTYNERENIRWIVPEIFSLYPGIHILVIDDNSPDGTGEAVEELRGRYGNLLLLSRPQKQGLGEAYKDGIRTVLGHPEFERVIIMDADGSHNPAYVADLLSMGQNYDLVIGSRYVEGGGIANWERWRYLLSRFGNIYSRLITGLPIHDLTAGFALLNMDTLRKIDFSQLQASGYAFQMELKFYLVHILRGTVAEVPIVFQSRREGESKISRHIIGEGLITPWRLLYRRLTHR